MQRARGHLGEQQSKAGGHRAVGPEEMEAISGEFGGDLTEQGLRIRSPGEWQFQHET